MARIALTELHFSITSPLTTTKKNPQCPDRLCGYCVVMAVLCLHVHIAWESFDCHRVSSPCHSVHGHFTYKVAHKCMLYIARVTFS